MQPNDLYCVHMALITVSVPITHLQCHIINLPRVHFNLKIVGGEGYYLLYFKTNTDMSWYRSICAGFKIKRKFQRTVVFVLLRYGYVLAVLCHSKRLLRKTENH